MRSTCVLVLSNARTRINRRPSELKQTCCIEKRRLVAPIFLITNNTFFSSVQRCFIVKRRLESAMAAFSKEVSFEVIWKPFFLNPTLTKAVPLVQHLSNMYGPEAAASIVKPTSRLSKDGADVVRLISFVTAPPLRTLYAKTLIWGSTVVGSTSNIKSSRRHLADKVKNCTTKRTARVARLFFLIQPVKSLICGVVVALIREFRKRWQHR